MDSTLFVRQKRRKMIPNPCKGGISLKKSITVYNLIFPMWGIYVWGLVFPFFLPILLPANFAVDSLMLFLLFALLKLPEKKHLYAKMIWWTWGLGFLADILASAVLIAADSLIDFPFSLYMPVRSVGAFLFITAGVVLAAALIYLFQRKWVLKKIDLEEGQKKKIALGMAILTAPYLMYLPPLG